jgi:hypothetical protein
MLLIEGGVNGGGEVAGDGTRSACGSLDGPIERTMGGWVADVGVGSGGGADLAEALDELTVVRRFLLGWPFEYVLLEGKIGGTR